MRILEVLVVISTLALIFFLILSKSLSHQKILVLSCSDKLVLLKIKH